VRRRRRCRGSRTSASSGDGGDVIPGYPPVVPAERPHPGRPEAAVRHTRRPEVRTAERPDPTATPAARRAAVEQTAGALTGVYGPCELESLRREWPA
jgi:hypothetical protein